MFKFKNSIEKAIDFLRSFTPQDLTKAYSFSDVKCTNLHKEINIIIPLCLTLQSISYLPVAERSITLNKFIKKSVSFIKKENTSFSYNYWIKGSKEYDELHLPNDLDDTSFAIAALKLFEEEVDLKTFINIIRFEISPGGPYRTWFTNIKDRKWRDIDVVANANFLYTSALFKVKLPKLEAYLREQIVNNNFSSPYYPSDIISLYFLAKYSRQNEFSLREDILSSVKRYKYKSLNLIERIYYLLIKLNLNQKVEESLIIEVLKYQDKEGSLPLIPFCLDFGTHSQKNTYTASKVITTALFLELLLNYKGSLQEPNSKNYQNPFFSNAFKIINKELEKFDFKEIIDSEFPAEKSLKALVIPIKLANGMKALSVQDKKRILELSIGLYFGWIGYTILDNVLDRQSKLEYVPISTTLIQLHKKYIDKAISPYSELADRYDSALDTCNKNYYWEATTMHNFSEDLVGKNYNYDYISNRLQPYLVALSFIPTLINVDPKHEKDIYNFFKSIVIIDQLNDDAHDWKDDLEGEILTYVVYLVLQMKKQSGLSHEEYFWGKVMKKIITICKKEHKQAEIIARQMNSQFMLEVLAKTFKPIENASSEIKKVKMIIKNFK